MNTRGDRGRLGRQDDGSRSRRPSSLRAPGVDESDGGPQGQWRILRGVLSGRQVYWEDEIDLSGVIQRGGRRWLRGGRHRQDNLHGRIRGNARGRFTVLFGPSLGNHGFEVLLVEVEEEGLLVFFRKLGCLEYPGIWRWDNEVAKVTFRECDESPQALVPIRWPVPIEDGAPPVKPERGLMPDMRQTHGNAARLPIQVSSSSPQARLEKEYENQQKLRKATLTSSLGSAGDWNRDKNKRV
ncbi:hypothetical protein GUJ93_ZPchr0002g23863 [Zizania palustris]|uniref:Uncharacterized protein n=1 Tax=Zizania palustris TaxID=103762 RepID=A0A8J5VB34_ZIZPA|nr:hypothetical protein GUJ93_ZPchr0002g23863 [Zizania palustris]